MIAWFQLQRFTVHASVDTHIMLVRQFKTRFPFGLGFTPTPSFLSAWICITLHDMTYHFFSSFTSLIVPKSRVNVFHELKFLRRPGKVFCFRKMTRDPPVMRIYFIGGQHGYLSQLPSSGRIRLFLSHFFFIKKNRAREEDFSVMDLFQQHISSLSYLYESKLTFAQIRAFNSFHATTDDYHHLFLVQALPICSLATMHRFNTTLFGKIAATHGIAHIKTTQRSLSHKSRQPQQQDMTTQSSLSIHSRLQQPT